MLTTKINTPVSYCVLPAGAETVNVDFSEEGGDGEVVAFG